MSTTSFVILFLKIPSLVPFQLVWLECSHPCNILGIIGHDRPLGGIVVGSFLEEDIFRKKTHHHLHSSWPSFVLEENIFLPKKSWDVALLYFCKSFFVFLQVFSAWSLKTADFWFKKTNGGPKLISFGPKSVTCLTGARTDLLWSKGHKVSYEGPNWPFRCLDMLQNFPSIWFQPGLVVRRYFPLSTDGWQLYEALAVTTD